MAMDLGDETFRPLLRDDMMSFWEIERVHYDPPQLPGVLADIPRGFVYLLDVEPANAHSFSRKIFLHRYRLAAQFPYPESGEMTLNQARVVKAQLALDVLTAGISNIFHDDWRYRDIAIPIEEAQQQDDVTNKIYTVFVDITLEWETGV